MDHQYIDQHDIAGRFLRKELPAADRESFRAHMVDCPECADRVLLAEMFQADGPAEAQVLTPTPPDYRLPLRARIVAYLTPWQLAMLLVLTVAIVVAVLGLLLLWELQVRSPR
jgi:anti-sigma factor RsiW